MAVLCFYLWIVKANSQENPLSIYSKHFTLLSSKCHKRTFVKHKVDLHWLTIFATGDGGKKPNSCKIQCHFDDKAMQKILLECSFKKCVSVDTLSDVNQVLFVLSIFGGGGITWYFVVFDYILNQ